MVVALAVGTPPPPLAPRSGGPYHCGGGGAYESGDRAHIYIMYIYNYIYIISFFVLSHVPWSLMWCYYFIPLSSLLIALPSISLYDIGGRLSSIFNPVNPVHKVHVIRRFSAHLPYAHIGVLLAYLIFPSYINVSRPCSTDGSSPLSCHPVSSWSPHPNPFTEPLVTLFLEARPLKVHFFVSFRHTCPCLEKPTWRQPLQFFYMTHQIA